MTTEESNRNGASNHRPKGKMTASSEPSSTAISFSNNETEGENSILSKDHLLVTARAVSLPANEEFLFRLVEALAEVVNADWVLIGTLSPDHKDQVKTLAAWSKGKVIDNFTYQLSGSPCQEVMNNTVCCYPCSVATQFPEDQMLTDCQIEGYVGSPLFGPDGMPFGVIATLTENPIEHPVSVESLVRIFATRVASEITRQRIDQERKNYVARLEQAHLRLQAQSEELRQARIEAEELARSRTQFLANMSHEIRTPMNGVMGLSELLIDTELDGQQLDLVQTIRESGHSLLEIINNILNFSKYENQQIPLEYSSFDLAAFLQDILKLLQEMIEKNGIRPSITIDSQISTFIYSAPHTIRQILVNLIGNAIKFTPENGEIAITVKRAENKAGDPILQFSVTDSGVGIPKEKHKLIFQEFAQADSSQTRQFGGTGLGLAICQQLVKALGGTISVESVPEQGSTFTFDIPYSETAPKQIVPTLEETSDSPERSQEPALNLLVVEDNLVNQKLIKHLLVRQNFSVVIANNGQEAVDMFPTGDFDAILMDIQMPIMGGDEATLAIRKMPGGDTIPIIAVTAHALPEERARVLELGMNAFLSKPINRDLLYQTLSDLCGGSAGATSSC